MGMIVAVSLRLVYLIFDRLLDWLTLLGRTSGITEAAARSTTQPVRPGRPAPSASTASAHTVFGIALSQPAPSR
jgi:hypothetical protein